MNVKLLTKYLKNYKVKCSGQGFYGGEMYFNGYFSAGFPIFIYEVTERPIFNNKHIKEWILNYYKNSLGYFSFSYFKGLPMAHIPHCIKNGYDNRCLLPEEPHHPNIKIYNDHILKVIKFFEYKNRKDIPKNRKNILVNIFLSFKKFEIKIPQEMIIMILGFIRIIEL